MFEIVTDKQGLFYFKFLSKFALCLSYFYIYIWLTEIRSLDSEMQTLVYENYNKFISATDTIRKVLKIKYTRPLGLNSLAGCKIFEG